LDIFRFYLINQIMRPEIIGSQIIRLEYVDSTNEYCHKLLRDGNITEGTIVVAEEQTSGKGYGTNIWESEKGKNLTFSIVLFPEFLDASRQFMLTMAISLGITDVISLYDNTVSIKWPNDIMIGEKKAGGILIENVIQENKIISSVLGIGLNINQTGFDDFLPRAVSLKDIVGGDIDKEEFLSLLCNAIDKRYILLKNDNEDIIRLEYTSSLYRFDMLSTFEDKTGKFMAKIIDIAVSGRLIVKKESGEIKEYDFKEIIFI